MARCPVSKSVRVPDKTHAQAVELVAMGYDSISTVIAVAVDRLYREEVRAVDRPGQWDTVRVDGKWTATVVQDGWPKSLVETSAPPESGASVERLWIDNDRMEVVESRN
jgi:hypothetical protein